MDHGFPGTAPIPIAWSTGRGIWLARSCLTTLAAPIFSVLGQPDPGSRLGGLARARLCDEWDTPERLVVWSLLRWSARHYRHHDAALQRRSRQPADRHPLSPEHHESYFPRCSTLG